MIFCCFSRACFHVLNAIEGNSAVETGLLCSALMYCAPKCAVFSIRNNVLLPGLVSLKRQRMELCLFCFVISITMFLTDSNLSGNHFLFGRFPLKANMIIKCN